MYDFAVFMLVAITMLCSVPSHAAGMLYDFEDDSQVAAWSLRTPGTDKLIKSDEYATSGKYSMQFVSPAFKDGMQQWPAFETKPAVSDWREYDRLVIDIINPSPEIVQLYLHISDSKIPFREGFSYYFDIPKMGFQRYVLSLSNISSKVDRADISIMHFFTVTPSDMRLHFDSFTLLKPGESEPAIAPGLWKQLAKLKEAEVKQSEAKLNEVAKILKCFDKDPIVKPIVDKKLAAWKKTLKSISGKMQACTNIEQLNAVNAQIKSLNMQPGRLKSELMLTSAYKSLRMPDNGMLIGFASPMTKVLPKDMPFDLKVSRNISLSLARNEKEAFQVGVLPADRSLYKVSVTTSDLKGPDGSVLTADNVACEVVGYVQTRNKPPYDVDYIGWWPDPILNFLGPVNIAAGDLQTFWVRVRVPKDQKPGTYKGKLTVSAEGVKPAVFNLTAKVRAFTLPDCTPLPTAITAIHPVNFQHIRDNVVGGAEKWAKMKYEYADFLADYYIDFDNLYHNDDPDFEIIKYLHDNGKLTAFNFGYFGSDPAVNSARFKPIYEKAKELGVLDHAYIYGYDECGVDAFPSLEAATKALKDEFPDIPVMTTSYDQSYGLDSVVKSMDAWCPLTPTYGDNLKQADKARTAGKMVWWYICCGPHHPYANWFVDYDAIEIRELMGLMTAKYKPDGFLYYSLAFWQNYMPITSGPYTKWNPISFGTYHGDGSIFCPGPDGRPLPTIRLENYRDGMDDFAYIKILEEIVVKYEARDDLSNRQRSWLKRAKAALVVPEDLVKSLVKYNRNPEKLEKYRTTIADLIDSSGMPDVDPWGKDFGVRGFGK